MCTGGIDHNGCGGDLHNVEWMQVRDATGQTVLQEYKVDQLSPDSAFVAKIEVTKMFDQ